MRSALAMSGRRSSSCDGNASGTAGSAGTLSRTAMLSSLGATPINTAMACSRWARCHSRSMAWARVLCSWVRAWLTSDFGTMPAWYWFSVNCSERA